MAELGNLGNEPIEVISDNDNIVIKRYDDGYEGGRTLDTTGYTKPTIPAGLVVIREKTTGIAKPMPLNAAGNAYAVLPAGHEYIGFVPATVRTVRPFVGVMTSGTINPAAAPYPYDTILTDLKAALPKIEFRKD